MIHVYHLSDRADLDTRAEAMFGKIEAVLRGLIHSHYVLVAMVRTKNLEAAYRYTNSIEDAWYDPAVAEINNVQPLLAEGQDGIRSTSMGDILVDGETGDVHVVATFGFTNLSEAMRKHDARERESV